MAELKFEIVEHIGVISEKKSGWRKELNRVSWNDKAAKYDIRDWSEDHSKMGKGLTLSDDEIHTLLEILNSYC